VFLADATGHGVQAALRTMLLKAEYDQVKLTATSPEQTLMQLNAEIAANYPGLEMQCTATCFDLELEPDGTARVRYATAAHPPLLVIRNGKAESIYQPGPFLGVVPEIELQGVDIKVNRGERLLVYSDGLEDQWNTERNEFGIERVQATLGDRSRDLESSVRQLITEWDGFLDGRRPDDDATLIAVEALR
jgi:serine phosphatase RsbU (regulator of sigma subunit)